MPDLLDTVDIAHFSQLIQCISAEENVAIWTPGARKFSNDSLFETVAEIELRFNLWQRYSFPSEFVSKLQELFFGRFLAQAEFDMHFRLVEFFT